MSEPFIVIYICCGRDAGMGTFPTWDLADEARNAWVSDQGDGHQRDAIVGSSKGWYEKKERDEFKEKLKSLLIIRPKHAS